MIVSFMSLQAFSQEFLDELVNIDDDKAKGEELISLKDGLDLVFKSVDIKNRKPIPLPKLRENDILWRKVVWRKLDLRLKMNQSIYFPIESIGDRFSLPELLLKGVKEGKFKAYDYTETEEFSRPLQWDDIKEKFGAKDMVKRMRDLTTDQMMEKIIPGEIDLAQVTQILLKEIVFFDKVRSRLDYRIVGLALVKETYKVEDVDQLYPAYNPVFWVYYPECREMLARYEIFNERNNAQKMSYDDLFLKRKFSGQIYQVSNKYGNRPISEYKKGVNALIEARRIENEIYDLEQDLWEY